MPNYSKARVHFSTQNKRLLDIPWQDLAVLYRSINEDLKESLQAELDEDFREFIAKKEQQYADSNEAAYEGNFTDQYNQPVAVVDPKLVEKQFAEQAKTSFIERYGLQYHVDWFMPQLITWLGNLPVYKNDDGFLSGQQFRNKNFVTDQDKGLYRFLMINERSSYLKLQYKAPAKQYCALVPLILYAQKLVKNIPYQAWDPEELHYVVNRDLADAMCYDAPEFSKDAVLEQRTLGLTPAGGGAMKNPETTHMLYGPQLKTGIFKDTPKLARVMMTQIWCAHPNNRTRYMVLDPNNWDKMPAPLISTQVFDTPVTATHAGAIDDWN